MTLIMEPNNIRREQFDNVTIDNGNEMTWFHSSRLRLRLRNQKSWALKNFKLQVVSVYEMYDVTRFSLSVS